MKYNTITPPPLLLFLDWDFLCRKWNCFGNRWAPVRLSTTKILISAQRIIFYFPLFFFYPNLKKAFTVENNFFTEKSKIKYLEQLKNKSHVNIIIFGIFCFPKKFDIFLYFYNFIYFFLCFSKFWTIKCNDKYVTPDRSINFPDK